jgi:hypothetical protein
MLRHIVSFLAYVIAEPGRTSTDELPVQPARTHFFNIAAETVHSLSRFVTELSASQGGDVGCHRHLAVLQKNAQACTH